MHSIDIYRGPDLLATIKPDNNSVQKKKIMGENELSVSFRDSRYIPFIIGDYCTVFGEVYKLNVLPVVNKQAKVYYEYSLTLKSEGSDLSRALFLFMGDDNYLKEVDFSLMGTAQDFADLILENILRIDTGWTLGEVIPTEAKLLTFSKENCYNALSKVAEEFETEFWIEGKKIYLTHKSFETGKLFQQGQFKGLYDVVRQNLDESGIATRLYAYGSDKNLPEGYRNFQKRLLLPDFHPGLVSNVAVTHLGASGGNVQIRLTPTVPTATDVLTVTVFYRLVGSATWLTRTMPPNSIFILIVPPGTYEVRFRTNGGQYNGLSTPTETIITGVTTGPLYAANPIYLEMNVDLYGVIEHTEIFEDVYPHRTGKITGVDATNPFKAVDSTIDFDFNAYLTPVAAKITFNTGQLSGYTFDISNYNHGTKTITFLKNKDEQAIDVPSTTLKPAIGDEYVITDIYMPQSYVGKAEDELKTKAEALLKILSVPQVRYLINFDPTHLARINYMPQIGHLIWIKDDELNVERKIRITSTTRNIVNEKDISVELADTIEFGRVSRIESSTSANAQDISNLERFVGNRDIFNNKMSLPTYNSDGEAETAGLTKGALYQTLGGEVRIKL